ncbi:hypothetical protein D9M69_660360 [compost metagenome]
MLRRKGSIRDRADEAEMLVRHRRDAVELLHQRAVILAGRGVDILDPAEHAPVEHLVQPA